MQLGLRSTSGGRVGGEFAHWPPRCWISTELRLRQLVSGYQPQEKRGDPRSRNISTLPLSLPRKHTTLPPRNGQIPTFYLRTCSV